MVWIAVCFYRLPAMLSTCLAEALVRFKSHISVCPSFPKTARDDPEVDRVSTLSACKFVSRTLFHF